MAPINFEENIREKLQERELTPSKESWEKLSAKLEKQVPQQTKSTFIWFAVAASFMGLLLVSTFFFNKDEVNTQIVTNNGIENLETNSEIQNQSEFVTEKLQDVAFEEPIEVSKIKDEVAEIPNKEIEKAISERPLEKTSEIAIANNVSKESVAVNDIIAESKTTKKENEEAQFITKKVEEVVVAVQQIQQENNTVTPGEIDALLAKAQRDIANNRILNSNIQKVDAAALLMDVETELEQSFRDRVFNMLGEGFNKVRSAVAERNN